MYICVYIYICLLSIDRCPLDKDSRRWGVASFFAALCITPCIKCWAIQPSASGPCLPVTPTMAQTIITMNNQINMTTHGPKMLKAPSMIYTIQCEVLD